MFVNKPMDYLSVRVHKTCRNIAEVVLCSECLRPRVLYSQKKVDYEECVVVRRTLEQIPYTCGSKLDIEPIILRGDPSSAATVFTRVMVRLNLTCNDPVEVPYYSSVLSISVYNVLASVLLIGSTPFVMSVMANHLFSSKKGN